MSQYKELADRLQEPGPGTAAFYEACDKAAAILRSLDAQPVAVYHGRCVENGHSDVEMLKMIPAGTKLYAAPVAAQPQQASKPLSDKPNMFWNHDDPESPYGGIGEFLNDEWCQNGLAVGDIRRVQRAISLPDVMVRVTAVSGDGDIDYIVEPIGGIKERG